MSDIKVPGFPESVSDGTVASWHKKPGDAVKRDDVLVEIETDKVMFEVSAMEDGVLAEILIDEGETVVADQVLGRLSAGKTPANAESGRPADESSATPASQEPSEKTGDAVISPSARKLISDHGLDATQVKGSGKGGRVLKEDVLKVIDNHSAKPSEAEVSKPSDSANAVTGPTVPPGDRPEKRVPMTRLRARIAERLIEAQQTAAILTTFNEVNMQPVMELRQRYRDRFEKEHGVRLGFMSFFVAAAVEALKQHPDVNASIEGNDIVYHGFYDVGIAVGSPRGLVVPVLRDADQMSMAEVESQILDYAEKAKNGSLTIEDMTGGTFTITNGGIFGSLLSTPILNPPQSAILGMHKIQERTMVENGEIVIRPMMYLALSYDHRIIDGRGAVQFLVTIKDILEDPARLILGV
ncbi:MAG: 2-oxoglutarate dehydrogenase complex dihydrolipoyllysine-residue succinyltransferase [Gammaproteobacteria bacterium]